MQENPDLVRMALWQHLDHYPIRSTEQGHDLLRNLIKNIASAQKLGHLRTDISAPMITVIIFILTSGWFQQDYQWILDLEQPSEKNAEARADAYLEAIQKILLKGLIP